MTTNLLPCPFCNGEPALHDVNGHVWIECTYCGIRSPSFQTGPDYDPAQLPAGWNQRVPVGEDAQHAARYRWIRQQKENLMVLFPEDENKFGLADVACALTGEALDAAIDAQIEADEARDFKYEDRD